MLSTLQGTLNLSEQLTPSAQSAFVLENQKNRQSHLSGIVMWWHCIGIFTNYDVKIVKDRKFIITGRR